MSWLGRRSRREPRIRERRGFSVANLVPSPDELETRPDIRLVVIGVIALVLFALMILRLFTLQVVDAKTYRQAVNANRIRTVAVPAPRGIVTARSNTILIGNENSLEIVLSRQEAVQYPAVIGQVAALTNQTPAQVKKILADPKYDPYQPAPIMKNAPAATVQYLEEHQSDYPGVSVQSVSTRVYPQGGDTAAHVLGYVGAISASELKAHGKDGYTQASAYGKTGIEQFYETALRGTAGSESILVNAQDKVVGTVSQKAPVPGDTVVLNLDLGLQQYAQQVLGDQILLDRQTLDTRSNKFPPAINGAVIVMNPHNGAVLAMASYPNFDLSPFVSGITQTQLNSIMSVGALNNYAISGLYTPGSTFKMVTATASLQQGLMGAQQYVNDTGTFTVPTCIAGGAGCVFHDDEAAGAGYVNLSSALTTSSDYYFYNLGFLFASQESKYGSTPIQNVAHEYGLANTTGVDLAGESIGRIDSEAERQKLHAASPSNFPNTSWYVGDNIEMAFGQGATAVTPIQMATAYSTLLNGGTRYAPQVAAGTVSANGALMTQFQPKIMGHVALNEAITGPIINGLLGVVNDSKGTAYGTFQQYAHYDPRSFVVGGKTGTASNQAGLEPNSWFVGFGGTSGNPDYVVVCVIDQGGYGASAAAPVVAQIFNYLATNPVGPVVWPTATNLPSSNAPATNLPAGTVLPTTPTTTPQG